MTPPPLPPGVEGHPVAPDIHTGLPEPDRDGWTDWREAEIRDKRTAEIAAAVRDLAHNNPNWIAEQVVRDIADMIERGDIA